MISYARTILQGTKPKPKISPAIIFSSFLLHEQRKINILPKSVPTRDQSLIDTYEVRKSSYRMENDCTMQSIDLGCSAYLAPTGA
jgi:hypothetical protein